MRYKVLYFSIDSRYARNARWGISMRRISQDWQQGIDPIAIIGSRYGS